MGLSVAIDGGQSGLRLRVSPDGRSGTAPGFSYHSGRSVLASMTEAIAVAARNAGLHDPVGVVCAGLSGLPSRREDRTALAARIATLLRAEEVRLCNDMVTAHAGALPSGHGVVLAVGTGVACLAIDAHGGARRVDGAGHLLGDAGSAFAIGRAALVAVQRQLDGRGPATILTEHATAHYGVGPADLHQRLYTSPTVVDDIARFAPAVVAAAEAGDAIALAVIEQAAADLVETVTTAAAGQPLPVACTGKVLAAGGLLAESFTRSLRDRAPALELVPAQGTPLDGAERLATEPLGVYEPLVHVHRRTDVPFGPRTLVVSCQAQVGNPLYGPESMARMAQAAVLGGAVAIRANGPVDIAAIRAVVDVPILGISKQGDRSGVYITPTKQAAADVVRAGADLVALDGTPRVRLDGSTLAEQIRYCHEELGVPVMADVDSTESGLLAREAGADLVATTLAGYVGERPADPTTGPDVELVARLAEKLDCPVVAEGRYRTAEQVQAALEAGAYAVVVGTAITNPTAITRGLLPGA